MRFSLLSTVCLASALLLISDVSVMAQHIRGARHSVIGTIGDANPGLYTSKISTYFGLNYSNLGLFADSELFPVFEAPSLFVFSIPAFADIENEFLDITYGQYLELVAASYEAGSVDRYKNLFINQNEYSISNQTWLINGFDDLSQRYTTYLQFGAEVYERLYPGDEFDLTDSLTLFDALSNEAFDRIHQADFVRGGGYLPLPGDFVTPQLPGEPGDSDPFEPLPDPLAQASASQDESSAPQVAVVPEPATLGLFALATAGALIRRR